MVPELKIESWLKAGIEAYKTNVLLVEKIFFDRGQEGHPSLLNNGLLADSEKLWIPNEYASGTLRWGGRTFPIVSNTASQLTVIGNPSLYDDPDDIGYSIISPYVTGLSTLLAQKTITIFPSFARVPTEFPCITIRLQSDVQADAYIGTGLHSYILNGVEVDENRTELTGNYLLSVWTQNRLETLWLYGLLANLYLRSAQQFEAWGFSDVSMHGTDIDPNFQLPPEPTYVRHLLLTATRDERALSTQDVEYITGLSVQVLADYARIAVTLPEPLP